MAIARDATSEGNAASGESLTFSHVNGAISNTVLLVGFIIEVIGDPAPAVTYGGVSMTQAVVENNVALGWVYIYYLAGPATGDNNVVIDWTGSAANHAISSSYTGCSQTGIPDSSATGEVAAGSSPLTVSTTVVADNCWLACFGASNLQTIAVGTGTNLVNDTNGGYGLFGDSNGVVGTGSQSQQVTWGGSNNVELVVISFAPVAAPAGSTFVPKISFM